MIVFLVVIFFGSLYEFSEGCNVGYYGESCSKECPKSCHNKRCNVISGKCLSCVEGYYSDINQECIPCPAHCTVCSSEKYCFVCKSGFRGDVCDDVCTNCKPYTSCDKNTGYCFENCSEGLSGELCNTPCDTKCKSCDRHNKDECILCADGYGAEKMCNQTDRICNIVCKELVPSDRQSSFTSKTHIGLIVGLVIGSVVTCIICCSIVFIIVRWRRIKRSRSSERNSTSSKNADGFELRGLLNKELKEIRNKPYVFKKTGIVTVLETAIHSGKFIDIEQEFRCVIKLPQTVDERPSAMLCDYEVMDSEILEEKRKDSSSDTYPLCFQTRRHNIKIQLIQGDIGRQKADIIVVGAASNHDLQSGSAFDSLLEQGGPILRTNYNKHYPNGIHDGEIAVIDSEGLNCDKIYLTSLPPWKEAARCGKLLRNFMRECLRLADKYDKSTIAFSSIVTGRHLGYPVDMAVSIMYGAVEEFDSSYSKTSLKEICIVVNKDDGTIKAFEDHEHMRIYGASRVGSLSTDFVGGKYKIQPVSGDLSTQQTYRMCQLKMEGRENRKKRVLLEYGTNLIKPQTNSEYRMVKDGCAIGPIQLQVQVGDLLNNSADAIVIGVNTNFDPKENVLDQDKVVMADTGELMAKCMILVPFQNSLADWRNKLVDCLEKAGQKSKQSVAFPLLGSGARQNSFPADGIGECVFAAIDDFTSQNPKSSVIDVRLVVPDSNAGCIPAIIAGLQARTTDVNFQWGIGKIFKSQLGFVADSKQFKESSVTIYSDAPINSDRCYQALVDRLGLEFSEKVVDADMDVIRCLEDEQISSIIDADIVVDSIFDKQTGKFTIVGPLRNVLAAVACLHNKMRQYKSEENSRNYAKVLYDQTRWYWLCENQVASKEEEIPYDMLSNFIIETAYKKGNHTMELHYKDGKIYAIDFEKLVEYRKTNTNDTVMLIRKDILKDFKISVQTKLWTSVTDSVKVVVLDNGVKYKKVWLRFLWEVRNGLYASKVKNSQSVQVVKIESVQNKTLYHQYIAKKKRMEQQTCKPKAIERKLWYGTTEANIQRIVNNGFNRSYGGLNGVAYGQGVYFAEDASYCVQSSTAENKPGTKRYMFLAKVLTGELFKGTPFMRVLPPVNPAEPTITYDSAVDDINKPMEFVIFHVTQAYPMYLITYTSE